MSLQGREEGAQSPIETQSGDSNSKSSNAPMKVDAGELLGQLSRELRTPLNTILGFASLLKDHDLSDEDRDQFIDRIVANGDSLLQLLDDASNFSRVAKGELAVENTHFSLSDMVYDVAQSLKSAAEKKDLGIHITFRNPIPRTIVSDPIKTRQILTNLLGNAIRYAEGDGFILVSLCFDQQSPHGSRVTVDIDDSGSGIARDANLTSEQRLDQLESSFNPKTDSNRPGLALAEKFAEALGGYIRVHKSDLGEGKSYVLSLPTGDIQDIPLINKKSSPSFAERIVSSFKKSNRLDGVKVLLAEDSEDNATVIRLYLAKEGARLTYVRNGLEAVEAIRQQPFDVILMDIQMPLLDGLEATRQIRQMGSRIPIIALTGHSLRDDAEKSLKAGADTHLTKPVLKDPLIEEIQKRISH